MEKKPFRDPNSSLATSVRETLLHAVRLRHWVIDVYFPGTYGGHLFQLHPRCENEMGKPNHGCNSPEIQNDTYNEFFYRQAHIILIRGFWYWF